MDTLFIFLLCFYFGSAKIKINHLIVPQSVEFGSVNELTLDCNYDVDGDTGIELKWFLNHNQIYQWIPETNYPPQAMGSIKDHIDPNFKISDDRNTMFRALHLTNVSPELSGNYSCKVSGFYSEAEVTKTMIVYDPADSGPTLEIIDGGVDRESVVSCEASGIFPKPDMNLYIATDNDSNIIFRDDDETFEFDDDSGLYNVTSILLFDSSNLTSESFYVCELKIPGSTYEEREIQYHDPKTEDGDVETQIEEDYLNFLNTTNTTETTFNQTQDYAEFETQIEEDSVSLFNFTQSTEIVFAKYDDKDDNTVTVKVEVGSSLTHLPSVHLLLAALLLFTLNLLTS